MADFRISLAGLICITAFAQDPPVDQPFRITVNEIIAPVTVLDHDGNTVNGLQPHQFRLFDNGKEQNIKVDVAYHPLSMVIAVQANSDVEAVLPQIKKIGSLLESVVVGDQGEAAVVAFDHRIRVIQEFTSDLAQISEALKKVTPGSTSSRMIDAVSQSVRMLRGRAANRRRVLLLVSETRDKASEGKVRDA